MSQAARASLRGLVIYMPFPMFVQGGFPHPAHTLSLLGPLGFFIAGGICSSFSHLLATPLDVVKTQQQAAVYSGFSGAQLGTEKRRGMLQTAMDLVKEGGVGSLLHGAGPTFMGYFCHGALKYGLFESFKLVFGVAGCSMLSRVPLLCLCAFLAELLATMVLCPAEAARIRLVTEPDYVDSTLQAADRLSKKLGKSCRPPMPRKVWAALRKLRREEGFREGWYGALVPLLFKQCLYTVAKLVTYDVLAGLLTPRIWLWNPFLARLIAAGCAATAAALASQPADTVFTCCSTDGGECPIPEDGDLLWRDEPAESIWTRMYETAQTLGWRGLFLGWRARICQMTFIVSLQLLIYDAIRPSW